MRMDAAHPWHGIVKLSMTITRFWELAGPIDENGCRPWLGDSSGGYGVVFFQDRMVGAHELAVFLTTGEIRPVGWDTCHSCHNSICVEPKHLRYGTHQENVDDMTGAGRQAQGSVNGSAKLTEELVLIIRHRLANGGSVAALANEYGVSDGAISMIGAGKRWAHVGGPITTQAVGRPAKGKMRNVVR